MGSISSYFKRPCQIYGNNIQHVAVIAFHDQHPQVQGSTLLKSFLQCDFWHLGIAMPKANPLQFRKVLYTERLTSPEGFDTDMSSAELVLVTADGWYPGGGAGTWMPSKGLLAATGFLLCPAGFDKSLACSSPILTSADCCSEAPSLLLGTGHAGSEETSSRSTVTCPTSASGAGVDTGRWALLSEGGVLDAPTSCKNVSQNSKLYPIKIRSTATF